MHGGTVCHAHGGRAPQVKAAAQGRLIYARIEREVARNWLRRRAEAAAMHPWADQIRLERFAGSMTPKESAKTLRLIATEITKAAKELRARAKALEAQAARGE